ncbi:MAG: iron-sulfur cluster assembly scaffold protein [Vicinamibacterales bacterium]|nr:iron-sulfur cluster assembly scaffold protein [Vicinamibacterales bacterium]
MRSGGTGPAGSTGPVGRTGPAGPTGSVSDVEGRVLSEVEGTTRYSDAVVARVREMARVGAWPPGAGVGTGDAGAMAEGTFVRIQVRRTGEGVEAVYKVFGCSAAIASASLVTEWIAEGRTLAAADVVTTLDLPLDRAHVAAMVVNAAESALASLRGRELIADSREPRAESREPT